MKKLLIVFMILCLCGCNNSDLEKLGYSLEDIETIKTYSEDIQKLFCEEYNDVYVELMHTIGFDINNLSKYMEYYGQLNNEELIDFVNKGLNIKKMIELYTNEYYLEKNDQLYKDNLNKYTSVRDCIEAVNTKTYLDYYTNIEPTDINKNYLMLINKYHALASDYEPTDLVDIEAKYGRGQTRKEVYEAYKKLQDDANALGYRFVICSAYRSYDYQDGLYKKYLNEEKGNQAKVDTYSARPGHSEHQSGLCLDLSDAVYGMDNFGLSDASKWLNENCYKYGFIIRYTEEKVKITGYQAEPWQIRYVGDSKIAKDIMDRKITFDEYYACFVEK